MTTAIKLKKNIYNYYYDNNNYNNVVNDDVVVQWQFVVGHIKDCSDNCCVRQQIGHIWCHITVFPEKKNKKLNKSGMRNK